MRRKVPDERPRLDAFYMLAAHDEQCGRQNWIANQFNLVAVNSPTFAVDRGYASNGMSSYLASGYNPTSHAAHFQLNDHHMAVGIGTEAAEDRTDIGNANSRIFARTSTGSVSCRSASIVAPTPVPGGINKAIGRTLINRAESAQVLFYRNGLVLGLPGILPTLTLANEEFRIPSFGNFATKQVQFGAWGGSLSASQIAAMDTHIAAYLTAIGATT